MKDRIRELINSSHVIKDSEKALYSKLLDFIDEQKQKQLLKIFQIEADSVKKIEEEANLEKRALNQSFILNINEFFHLQEKKAIKAEENEEQENSENILNKLNEA
jgi:hypothetical protein